MTMTLEDHEVAVAELEVMLDEIETRRLDLPVDAVAERITLRQTQRELERRLALLSTPEDFTRP